MEVDRQYFRSTEVELLQGDTSKARKKLGWKPKVGFAEPVKMMVESDLKEAEHELMCLKEGYCNNGIRRQKLYPQV